MKKGIRRRRRRALIRCAHFFCVSSSKSVFSPERKKGYILRASWKQESEVKSHLASKRRKVETCFSYKRWPWLSCTSQWCLKLLHSSTASCPCPKRSVLTPRWPSAASNACAQTPTRRESGRGWSNVSPGRRWSSWRSPSWPRPSWASSTSFRAMQRSRGALDHVSRRLDLACRPEKSTERFQSWQSRPASPTALGKRSALRLRSKNTQAAAVGVWSVRNTVIRSSTATTRPAVSAGARTRRRGRFAWSRARIGTKKCVGVPAPKSLGNFARPDTLSTSQTPALVCPSLSEPTVAVWRLWASSSSSQSLPSLPPPCTWNDGRNPKLPCANGEPQFTKVCWKPLATTRCWRTTVPSSSELSLTTDSSISLYKTSNPSKLWYIPLSTSSQAHTPFSVLYYQCPHIYLCIYSMLKRIFESIHKPCLLPIHNELILHPNPFLRRF